MPTFLAIRQRPCMNDVNRPVIVQYKNYLKESTADSASNHPLLAVASRLRVWRARQPDDRLGFFR